MVSIEIAGENLIVIPEFPVDIILRNPVPRLMYVVNWKTGKKKAVCEVIFSVPKHRPDVLHLRTPSMSPTQGLCSSEKICS